MTDQHWATCCWCHRTVTLAEAVDEGWCPSWWVGELEQSEPVCTSCEQKHLQESSDGEMELKPGEVVPWLQHAPVTPIYIPASSQATASLTSSTPAPAGRPPG